MNSFAFGQVQAGGPGVEKVGKTGGVALGKDRGGCIPEMLWVGGRILETWHWMGCNQ